MPGRQPGQGHWFCTDTLPGSVLVPVSRTSVLLTSKVSVCRQHPGTSTAAHPLVKVPLISRGPVTTGGSVTEGNDGAVSPSR